MLLGSNFEGASILSSAHLARSSYMNKQNIQRSKEYSSSSEVLYQVMLQQMKLISPHDDAGNVSVCSSQREAWLEKQMKRVETGDNETN